VRKRGAIAVSALTHQSFVHKTRIMISASTFIRRIVCFFLLALIRFFLFGPPAAQGAPDDRQSFRVDAFPVGLAFDGANIWVTSDVPSGRVTKLRARDGVNLGSFPAGGSTLYAAFDGANIWFTNPDNDTVTRLRASDGAPQGTFSVGSRPTGILFGGAHIWVANEFDNSVSKLQASDGTPLGKFRTGTSPFELVYDGTNIWITNLDSGNVTKLRASDGTLEGEFAVGGRFPSDICFDGENIWVATDRRVAKLRASDGTLIMNVQVGEIVSDLAFDGSHIWAARSGDGFRTKDALIELNADDGSIEHIYGTQEHPIGVLFDGPASGSRAILAARWSGMTKRFGKALQVVAPIFASQSR
jgi:outer membrane lipoprotein-sorting protein